MSTPGSTGVVLGIDSAPAGLSQSAALDVGAPRASPSRPHFQLGSDRLAAHLGWLSRQPWPDPPAVTAPALGMTIAHAARLQLFIKRQEQAWAVRDAAEAIEDGLRRLGLRLAPAADAEGDPHGRLRFVICTFESLESSVETLTHGDCLVVTGLASPAGLAGLRLAPRLRALACTDPAAVALLRGAGAPTLLWSPVSAPHAAACRVEDPLIAGLPRAARAPLPTPDIWAERPLDIVSLGAEQRTRAHTLGEGAAALSRRSCVLVNRRAMWRLPGEPILAKPAAFYIFRRSRLVLNVHEGEAAALDWNMGVLDAMALGAVALSTPCFPHPFLVKGEHYLEETPDHLLQLAEWLLEAPDGRRTAEAVRTSAAAALALEAGAEIMAARLLHHAMQGL